jgi:hypothetical protein
VQAFPVEHHSYEHDLVLLLPVPQLAIFQVAPSHRAFETLLLLIEPSHAAFHRLAMSWRFCRRLGGIPLGFHNLSVSPTHECLSPFGSK